MGTQETSGRLRRAEARVARAEARVRELKWHGFVAASPEMERARGALLDAKQARDTARYEAAR